MQKNSEDFSMQEALRLAQSPAGQQLLAMLRQADTGQIQQAMDQANAGDLKSARKTLNNLLADPEIRKMLGKLGR